jgi:hypothetical protein
MPAHASATVVVAPSGTARADSGLRRRRVGRIGPIDHRFATDRRNRILSLGRDADR